MKIYKNILLPVVLYGRRTWPLTLREEHTLRVYEIRVLKRISGTYRDEMVGDWNNLNSENLHTLSSSSDIIRMMKPRRMR
jgi:hypothetical protein